MSQNEDGSEEEESTSSDQEISTDNACDSDSDNGNEQDIKQQSNNEVKEAKKNESSNGDNSKENTPVQNNPYIDSALMHTQQKAFSPKQNQQFVSQYDNSQNHESSQESSSSSDQEISTDTAAEREVIDDTQNENESNHDSSEDNDVILNLSPKIEMKAIYEQIPEEIKKNSNNQTLKDRIDKYGDLSAINNNGVEYDWSDFVIQIPNQDESDDSDEIGILEYAFEHKNMTIASYLLCEKQIHPFVQSKHCIYYVLDKYESSNDERYKELLHNALSTLRPPIDKGYEDSFKVLFKFIDFAFKYDFSTNFLCDIVSNVSFVNSLNEQKFLDILDKLKSHRFDDNKQVKIRIWKIIFENIVKYEDNIVWLMKCNEWQQFIFKDLEIFEIILSRTDRFVEKYKQSQRQLDNAFDTSALVWAIMTCVSKGDNLSANTANTAGTELICDYISKWREHFHSFTHPKCLNKLLVSIIKEKELFNDKIKKEYVTILYYYFFDLEGKFDLESSIITEIMREFSNNKKRVKVNKLLFTIFIALMVRFSSKNSKENNVSRVGYSDFRKRKQKTMKWLKNTEIGKITLKQLIEQTITDCFTVSNGAQRNFFFENHGNILIQFAKKLSVFANGYNASEKEIISQIFCDNNEDSTLSDYFAQTKLQTFVYTHVRECFNSANTQNVHVLFVKGEEKEEKHIMEDNEEDGITNIHLLNLSILNGTSLRQIGQFVLQHLKVRYGYNNMDQYSDMNYNILNKKGTKWNRTRDMNDSKCLLNKYKSSVLLMTNADMDANISIDTFLVHIHRYSLKYLKENENVYFYDTNDDGNWRRGKVVEIKREESKNDINLLQIVSTDQRDSVFAGDSGADDGTFLFDIFSGGDFKRIIPSSLLNWLPLKYFEALDNNSKNEIEEWQKPQFSFISSYIIGTNTPLYAGKIKYKNANDFELRDDVICGLKPYPSYQTLMALEMKRKISIDKFVSQHSQLMNDDYNNTDRKLDRNNFVWSTYSSDKDQKEMHTLLSNDQNNIQMATYTNPNNKCKYNLYFFTTQHLHKMSEKSDQKPIMYDFLRFGRDDKMENACFILTEFIGGSNVKFWSSVMNDRFGCVFSKDLDFDNAPFVYPFLNITFGNQNKNAKKDKKAKKHKRNSKKNSDSNPKFQYSKQKSANKMKKNKNELAKDWGLAMDMIKDWARKNRNCIPKDAQKWESVIKSQIMPKLWPSFEGPKDTEQLAVRAVGLDFNELFPIDEEENKPPHIKKEVKQRKERAKERQKQFKEPEMKDEMKEAPHYSPHSYNNENESIINKSGRPHQSHQIDFNYEIHDCPVVSIHTIDGLSSENFSHGSIIGCPKQAIPDMNKLIESFKNVSTMCTRFGIKIAKTRFIFARNWDALANKYNANVNDNTLFLYLRFKTRNDTGNFQLDMPNQPSHNFSICCQVKKPKGMGSAETLRKAYVHNRDGQNINRDRNSYAPNLPKMDGMSDKRNFANINQFTHIPGFDNIINHSIDTKLYYKVMELPQEKYSKPAQNRQAKHSEEAPRNEVKDEFGNNNNEIDFVPSLEAMQAEMKRLRKANKLLRLKLSLRDNP